MKAKLLIVYKDSLIGGTTAQILQTTTIKDAKKLAADFMRGSVPKDLYGNIFFGKCLITASLECKLNPMDILAYVIYTDKKIIQAEFVQTRVAMSFIKEYLPDVANIKIS